MHIKNETHLKIKGMQRPSIILGIFHLGR